MKTPGDIFLAKSKYMYLVLKISSDLNESSSFDYAF